MPIELNSFILPDNVIKKMVDKLEESRRKKIELGSSLCKPPNSNFLKIGKECIGGECSIVLPEECEENDIYVTAYHTHFNESSRPSSQDIPILYKRGLGCIGGIGASENATESNTEIKEINCYLRTKPKDIEEIYRFKDKLIFIRDRLEKKKEIDKFVAENFKIINVI